ncbi:MAG TPA: hypothetical protein VHQ95_26225 [Pyrinomonadaceae bacterium]|nr:hypothetical protein [Pyrinomonadaceae bacterium]
MIDTEPEVERKFYVMIMSRSGEERFMMGIRSFEAARTIVRASLPKDLSEHELKRKLFERIYGAPVEEFVAGANETSEESA